MTGEIRLRRRSRTRSCAASRIGGTTEFGVYTNFVNLLDLCALAVPAGFDPGGLPVGATLIAPCFNEMMLLDIGGEFHRRAGVPMGASGRPLPG